MFPHSMHPNTTIQSHTCWNSISLNLFVFGFQSWKQFYYEVIIMQWLQLLPFSSHFWVGYKQRKAAGMELSIIVMWCMTSASQWKFPAMQLALYTSCSGWLEPAEASENQFNLV